MVTSKMETMKKTDGIEVKKVSVPPSISQHRIAPGEEWEGEREECRIDRTYIYIYNEDSINESMNGN